MSIVSKPRRRSNDEPVVVSTGNGIAERPGEPIPPRRPRPFSPSQAEAEATAIAERCAGLPSESLYAFKAGAYESLYGELYQHYLDAVGKAERMKRDHYPFGIGDDERA